MNLMNLARLLTLISLLALGLLNIRGAAARPLFGVTTILTPQDSQVLHTVYFKTAGLFGKSNSRRSAAPAYWVPTAEQIAQAQGHLYFDAQTSADATDARWDLLGYRPHSVALTRDFRQCAGVMEGGRKCILINGFTASDAPIFATGLGRYGLGGTEQYLATCLSDNGSPFRAAYDLTTARIIYLNFDGLVAGSDVVLSEG